MRTAFSDVAGDPLLKVCWEVLSRNGWKDYAWDAVCKTWQAAGNPAADAVRGQDLYAEPDDVLIAFTRYLLPITVQPAVQAWQEELASARFSGESDVLQVADSRDHTHTDALGMDRRADGRPGENHVQSAFCRESYVRSMLMLLDAWAPHRSILKSGVLHGRPDLWPRMGLALFSHVQAALQGLFPSRVDSGFPGPRPLWPLMTPWAMPIGWSVLYGWLLIQSLSLSEEALWAEADRTANLWQTWTVLWDTKAA